MKYAIYLLAGIYIIGGFTIIKFFMLPKEINIEQIKKSIVIILPEKELISYKNNPKGIFEKSKTSGIGAGFFISKDGKIQTVNHIIENDKINYKIIYNNKVYNSIVLSRNPIKDLAILKIITTNNKTFSYLKTTTNIKKNDETFSFGINPKKLQIVYNTGILINKKNKLENISNLLKISNILKPGFSGGPIINNLGEVIGINYAISEGKNYGIEF